MTDSKQKGEVVVAKPGRWVKGQSGNPKGRAPKGYAFADKLRSALVEDIPRILAKQVAKALEGDPTAARIILDRVLPVCKPTDPPVALPPLTGTLTEQTVQLLRAMSDGLIQPTQTAQLLMAIGSQARVIEVDALVRRVEALESRRGNGAAHAQAKP